MEDFFDNIIIVDPGDTVLCDLCNKDYTFSEETGGFLFNHTAVCPDCAPDFLVGAEKYNETSYITERAAENETFRDFVYRVRNEKM